MAELYKIKNETLTSMADKIRVLSGTEGTITTTQMDSKLDEANTEVASQAELIEQIIAALNEKFGSGASIITFTIEGTNYQAEEGMTWGEWVESKYNTDGYYIFNITICSATSDTQVYYLAKTGLSYSEFTPFVTDIIDSSIEYFVF